MCIRDRPYAILGSAGQNGGNFNAAISTVGATTYVKSYANVNVTSTGGVTVPTYVPTYATITANSNITNISFNYAPVSYTHLSSVARRRGS